MQIPGVINTLDWRLLLIVKQLHTSEVALLYPDFS